MCGWIGIAPEDLSAARMTLRVEYDGMEVYSQEVIVSPVSTAEHEARLETHYLLWLHEDETVGDQFLFGGDWENGALAVWAELYEHLPEGPELVQVLVPGSTHVMARAELTLPEKTSREACFSVATYDALGVRTDSPLECFEISRKEARKYSDPSAGGCSTVVAPGALIICLLMSLAGIRRRRG
jgi:hypothetical protein